MLIPHLSVFAILDPPEAFLSAFKESVVVTLTHEVYKLQLFLALHIYEILNTSIVVSNMFSTIVHFKTNFSYVSLALMVVIDELDKCLLDSFVCEFREPIFYLIRSYALNGWRLNQVPLPC